MMTDKAYIVVNEQQEHKLLEKLEHKGFLWIDGINKPTKLVPRKKYDDIFPYAIIIDNYVSWKLLSQLEDEEIVFDGRKEEQMSDKYVVSQKFMNELEEWKNNLLSSKRIYAFDFDDMFNEPEICYWWRGKDEGTDANNRLIAIIRWVNGEDVFEVEKLKKWVVRSKETDSTYCYAQLLSENNNTLFMGYSFANATRFDTKEEAESWANSHQEVIGVEG